MAAEASLVLPEHLGGDVLAALRMRLLTAARSEPVVQLVLDGSDVRLVSAAGLGVLVAAGMLMRERGSRLVVMYPSEELRRAIAASRSTRYIHVLPES